MSSYLDPAGAAPSATGLPRETPATTFGVGTAEQDPMGNFGYTVAAYSVLWVILLAFVFLSWRRQVSLESRLADLEQALAKAPPPRTGKA